MNHSKQQPSLDEVYRLFRSGTKQYALKGTTLIDAQTKADDLYYMDEGYVKVYSQRPNGEQYVHILYGNGDLFPLAWLELGVRHNIYFETLNDCSYYTVPIATINDTLRTKAELSYAMMQQAIRQYRVYSLRVDNLEYRYASERLAYRLVSLANRFGQQHGNSVVIRPPLTHQLIGNSINLSRESVSREMERLMRRGLVSYTAKRQIVIPDVAKLAAEFNFGMTLHEA